MQVFYMLTHFCVIFYCKIYDLNVGTMFFTQCRSKKKTRTFIRIIKLFNVLSVNIGIEYFSVKANLQTTYFFTTT